MPKFFFDVQDGHLIPDATGLELSDFAAAEEHAIDLAEVIVWNRPATRQINPWHIIIKDEASGTVGTVTSIVVDI